MADMVPWNETHTTYAKGSRWWGRLFPYVTGDGDDRQTVYGDWWTAERMDRLALWQGVAEKALLELMAPDPVQIHQARIKVLAARAARETREAHGGGWSFTTWLEKATAAVRPTPEEEVAIEAESQRRMAARDALKALLCRHVDKHPDGRMARIYRGHPSSWSVDEIAAALIHHGSVLLRLARNGFIPSPGDLVPPVVRDGSDARDFSEPASANV